MRHYLQILAAAVLLSVLPKAVIGQSGISGRILEEGTMNPVPYANIWIKGTNIGATADEQGYYSITADSICRDKSVIISAVGYFDTIIPIGKVRSETVLRQREYQLTEIAVYPKKKRTVIINDLSDKKINGGILSDTTPRIAGRYFPYEKDNITFRHVKSVIVYSRDTHKGKFNLRLYSFDTLNMRPVRELVNSNIIVETRSSLSGEPKPVEIDLSEYHILFPETGLLVCVEWLILAENRYKVTINYTDGKEKNEKIMYAPNLGATMDMEGYVYQYTKGVWWKPPRAKRSFGSGMDDCYFNPAISLKLTN